MLISRVLSLGIWTDCEYFDKHCRSPLLTSRSSAYLRQSILLTAYETPETRSLFNTSLKNVAGKIRTERRWNPVSAPDGIEQVTRNPP